MMSPRSNNHPRSSSPREIHSTEESKSAPGLSSSTAPSDPTYGERMDITPPTSATMAPPLHSSPENDHTMTNNHNGIGAEDVGNPNNIVGGNGLGVSAAAAAQQPKVVQTAFIHKLYNMLEEPNTQKLISWSPNNESFVMSPSNEFSKVLSQYFKHTNISSFVRQLNMYGFHKVSDVFHTGSPESTLWEFKHGNGNFKRGDLVGLREIKRRASRHALIHRDSFSSTHKPSPSVPGTPAEPMPDPTDARLVNLEHNLYDLHARLARTEESYSMVSAKCQALTEGLLRCHQWNQDLSQFVNTLIPETENQLHRDVSMMQKEIGRQTEMLRTMEEPHEALLSGRQPYFSNISLDAPPLSPRQTAQDDLRRSSLLGGPRQSFFRPPVPSHSAVSPRRFGSIGNANAAHTSFRPQAPPQPPPPPAQHPLASITSPTQSNLARRHTSADIRLQGWPGATVSPFGSGQSSAPWPSSPNRTVNHENQQVRDILGQYEMNGPRQSYGSRQTTPPLTSDTTPSTLSAESGWSFSGSKFPSRTADSSYPPTRRSSMALLLNPAETAETEEEEDSFNEDRKRKRVHQ
ncbi:MAG: hypothetical protein M1812_003259 [Candelaria pacifica]|nr:MAG: hypothetical protein M1812_003259 [Candelaria pacifica]